MLRPSYFRFLSCFLVVAVVTSLSVGCAHISKQLSRFEFQQPHMGTLFTITLYAPDEATAQEATAAAFARVGALDRMMTDYDPESELMRLCREPVGKPVRVSQDLFTVLAKADQISELSGGAFDVTIGPLVRQWRRARRTGILPDEAAMARARESVGWRKLKLDKRQQTVTLTVPNMQLDLGGIAKGYAADAALRVLCDRGLPRALVAASGDLAIGAPPPGECGWRVQIGALRTQDQRMDRTLVLNHAAVSTSGDAEQFVEIGGIRYSHILDPHTGVGLTNPIQVTAVAKCATDTDALATAVSILGVKFGLALAESRQDMGAIITEPVGGRLETHCSLRIQRNAGFGRNALRSKRDPDERLP